MNLKPQDILVALKLISNGSMAYGSLAAKLGMSASEVHAAVKRAAAAGLVDIIDPEHRQVRLREFYSFLVHGVSRAFPAKAGPIVRGMPTAHAAPPLSSIIATQGDLPPVWPDPEGNVRGYELSPIYKSAPVAASRDPVLYERLALVDALRAGRTRERKAAATELRRQLLDIPNSQLKAGPFGITENDLDSWSDTYTGSEAILPDLIRRLVISLVPRESIIEIHFPAHKAVNQAGFDGELKTQAPTLFAETGASVWEISTSRDIYVKANKDFADRTDDPLGWDKSATTYVALTSRIWREPGKSTWLRQKREEQEWANVRVYDATDIAHWLVHAPAVQTWFCSAIGRPIEYLETANNYFERWSARTAPDIDEKVVLAGRDHESQEVTKWLKKKRPSIFSVGADTIEESVVFFCAALRSAEDPEKEDWISRTIIAKSKRVWRNVLETAVADSCSPLILVPDFPEFDGVLFGAEHHYVLVPRELSRQRTDDVFQIELGPIDRGPLAEALREFVFDSDEARRLAYECGGKLTVLQRLLGYEAPEPDWARNENPDVLAALVLAGSWDPNNPEDKNILVQLTGNIDYGNIEKLATILTSISDPPLRRQGQILKWRSNSDVWQRLSRKFSPSAIRRFCTACEAVLGKASPRYDLPPDERMYASMRNAELPESDAIRRGLAEGLAYLAVHAGDLSSVFRTVEVIDQIDAVVRQILKHNWKNWATLGEQLAAIAEASPEAFLTAVEEAIGAQSRELHQLFRQDPKNAGIFGECCHSGLLWALEGLAWHSDYFARVVRVFIRLCDLDQEKAQYSNRPETSLLSLFHPAVKQTACSNERRLTVLRKLSKQNRPATWLVVRHVLEICAGGSSVSNNHRPQFREWILPEPLAHYSPQEISEFLDVVRALARGQIADDPARLLELFENRGAWAIIGSIFDYIEGNVAKLREWKPEHLIELQNALREWVAHQYLRGGGDTEPSSCGIQKAKQLIDALESKNNVVRTAWLFSQDVVLPDHQFQNCWRKRMVFAKFWS